MTFDGRLAPTFVPFNNPNPPENTLINWLASYPGQTINGVPNASLSWIREFRLNGASGTRAAAVRAPPVVSECVTRNDRKYPGRATSGCVRIPPRAEPVTL